MSTLKKIAALSLGQGVNVIISFLFLPFMARVLPVSDYGTYGQVLLIVSFTVALFSFGQSQIIYVYLNKDFNSKEVLTSNILVCMALGLIASLGLYMASDLFSGYFSNQSLGNALKYYAFAPVFILPFNSLNSFLIYKEKVKTSIKISVVSNLIKVISVVCIIHFIGSIDLILLTLLLITIFQFSWGVISLKNDLCKEFKRELFSEQIKFGFPLGLTGILGTGVIYIDGFMVSKFLGVESYAICRNGALEVPYIATIYSSIAAIIMPEVASLFGDKKFKEIVALKKKVIINTMAITYPILVFLIFNSNELIVLYLGEKYQQSAIVFSIFNLTLLIRVNSYNDILTAANKGKVLLNYYLLVFILNCVLNIIFIKLWGIKGAAIATVVSLFVFAILLLNKSMKYVNSSILEVIQIKSIAKLLGFCILLCFALTILNEIIISPIIYLIIAGLVYFSIVIYFVFKQNLISERIKEILLSKFKR